LELSEKIKRPYGGEDYSSINMRGLVALAEGGNKAALSSLKTTAKYLALGIANIVNSLNPEMVIIGGEVTSAWAIVEPVIHETLKPKVFARNLASVHIAPSSLKENASLEGALLQALSTKLSVGKVA
jgi:predicted NBD/HSP70 family sugar kinase